ncbi:MAG: phenylacetate--CoA ligase family protein, partial [Thermoplasmata archaeon]|nr:phenylacetate--CoA ligase family protein [Thermoplasmata archaeon]
MYPKITRHLLYPLIDLKRGSKTLKYLRELNQSQWWSRERLEELQNKRLKALIRHAYKNVPYYHKMFKQLRLLPIDIKTTKDLSKLPLLTKENIRK